MPNCSGQVRSRPMPCLTRASSAGVAWTPSSDAAGSPGASLIMMNTTTTTPAQDGYVHKLAEPFAPQEVHTPWRCLQPVRGVKGGGALPRRAAAFQSTWKTRVPKKDLTIEPDRAEVHVVAAGHHEVLQRRVAG